MKKLVLILCTSITAYSCIIPDFQFKKRESELPDPLTNLSNVSESRLASIDSAVNAIDLDTELYLETTTATVQDDIKHNLTYVSSYNKKGGILVKCASTDENSKDTLNMTAYFVNEELIKIESSVKDKKLDRSYIYFEKNKPVFYSANLERTDVAEIKRQSDKISNYFRRKN